MARLVGTGCNWVIVAGFAASLYAGCATSTSTVSDDGDDPQTSSTTGASGGMAGAGGEGGNSSACAVDCSTIQAPPCQVAACNPSTGQCEIQPGPDDEPCDDGQFCTVNDTCQAGVCTGGEPNDCGMNPGDCDELVCNEDTDSCTVTPLPNGTTCTNSQDLCLTNGTCSNGLCLGTPKDCFFFPVPNDCHVATCNPQNGMCEAVPGNESQPCVDTNDLCTSGKTCSAGACVGGMPKDCSAQTVGCFDGVCNPATGVCEQVPVLPGMQCQDATDQCNVGICDTMGNCNPQPANQGMACNDNNACTTGETCNNGACTGGTTTTTCVSGDNCCPTNCTVTNDLDCAYCDWSTSPFPIALPNSSSVGDMAFDDQCNIYIANSSSQVVRVNHNTTTTSTISTFTGYTRGIAFNKNDGLLYVANGDRIYRMTTTGANKVEVPNSVMGSILQGMAFAPPGWGSYGGHLIVTRNTGSIYALNPQSPAPVLLGTTTANISDVAFGGSTLYVAAYDQQKVLIMSPSGAFTTFANTPCSPDGIAVHEGTNVFIACGSNDAVYKLAIPGGTATLIGSPLLNSSWAPAGLLFDGLDNVIVFSETPTKLEIFTP